MWSILTLLYTLLLFFFFFNDTATTEIYTLSLHDALPISSAPSGRASCARRSACSRASFLPPMSTYSRDRKSTRLNSSHLVISYAVFCLKKKKLYMRSSSSSYFANFLHHLPILSQTDALDA